MKTIHDMQVSRRMAAIYTRPLLPEPDPVDPVMAALARVEADLAVCKKLLAEITEILGLGDDEDEPDESEPVF